MYCPTISLDFVESLSCTVPISTCTVRKSSCYVLVVSSILVSSCLNFNLSIPTFQLNLLQNSSCTVQNFHLTLLNRYLVLSHIRLVMSENRLLLTYFQLVHTQNSNFSVEKVIKYCPTISPYFVESTSSTVPISTWTVQKLTLICRKIRLDLVLILNDPFRNNDLVYT
jgi:hypothetical protein